MNYVPRNYSYVFNFEREFRHEKTRMWMIENWSIALYFVGIYLILIFGGQHLMQSRPRFKLRGVLVVWNTMLAVFSIMGAFRTIPEFLHTLTNYGWYHSVCIPTFVEQDKVSGFWASMFIFSKLPELGDTLFIVLRKQPLIFLHWYHHITVLLYTWYFYTEHTASCRWFMVMNYCVHGVMYSYYALRSMGYSPPKSIAMVITTMQLIQMVVGFAISIWAYNVLKDGQSDCNISPLSIKLSTAMYFSYFVLFAQFFFKAYLASPADRKKKLSKAKPIDNSLFKSKVN